MPTLNIEGRRVKIDDGFLSLSPEEQNLTVEEIAGSIGIAPSGGLAAQPEGSGLALNTTAGLNQAIYTAAGAPVDLMRGTMNLGVRGFNAATGSDIGMIPEDSFGGSKSIAQGLGAIDPVLDPANTVAATTGERIARGIGEGVGYAVAPEAAVAGLARVGALAPRVADTAGKVFGRGESVGAAAGNAAIGGLSGAGASAAMEATPDQYDAVAGMGGGMVAGGVGTALAGIPGLARTGAKLARDYAAPLTQEGRERLAAQRIRANATDINAVREDLDNLPADLVPGSSPTTFQVTGDMGLGAMERASAVKYPERFGQRRADQNAARVGALEGVQPTGAPEKVADAVRTRLKAIDDETQSIFDRATQTAQGRAEAIGPGRTPEASGEAFRASLETARGRAKAQEKALWSAVDPDGTMALSPANVREQTAKLLGEMTPSAQPLTASETQMYDAIGAYSGVVSLRDVTDLQSNLKSSMREERSRGETPAYRRMSIVNGAIQRDLERVLTAKALKDEIDVQKGRMAPENTLATMLQREQEQWFAERQALRATGGDGPTGFAENGRRGSPAVPGAYRTEGEARSQSGIAPRDPRLPSNDLQPNFDEAALGRLNAARNATRERAQTFDNDTLGPIRRRPATNAPYDMPSSVVPARIFFPQAKSYDAIQQARRAVGDEALFPAIQDYAVDRLRKVALREDGTFDPAKLANWRRAHADAFRAFPELDARLADAGKASETMGTVLRQRKLALDEAQRGAVGRFLQLDSPEDVTRNVGALFGAQDAQNRIGRLRQAIGANADAQQGLRKAVVDHMVQSFIGNTEAGTSGIGTMKSDGFQTFVKKSKGALRLAGFSDDEVTTMQRIADDLQRSNRSVASVRNPGGSDTAQNLAAGRKGGPSLLERFVSNVGIATAGVSGFVTAGPLAAIGGAAGAKTVADMRTLGIETVDDLIADALLNPPRARMLLSIPTTTQTEAATLRKLGEMYRRSAATSTAVTLGGPDERKPLEVTITGTSRNLEHAR